MTDLQITKLCAEAMGLELVQRNAKRSSGYWSHDLLKHYDPLHDDAQAMALVKKLSLSLWGSNQCSAEWKWHAEPSYDEPPFIIGHGETANRAICECVAQIQASKAEKPKP